jgi:PhnB protein
MPAAAKIPEGFSTVTPTLIVNEAAKTIDLYTKAFGAQEMYRMACPDSGKIMHACIQIGSSKVFLCDTNPEMGCANPTNSCFYLYFDNVDATFAQAVKAGLKEMHPVQDMFWGDRTGTVADPAGNRWTLASHVRDVSPQEMEEARKKLGKKAA